jgi:hypothetical protein
MKKTKTYYITLSLPQVVALLIVYGRHVVQCMTNNPSFPSPNPALATVSKDLDDLETSEANVHARTKGAAAVREVKRKTVVEDLTSLKQYAQTTANQNPENAIAIIESAGMSLKKASAHHKPALQALMGLLAGEVLLRARAAGRSAAYEWQYSADGGKTWVALPLTNGAKTSVQGLSVGTTYLFRFRATVKNTIGDWSQNVSLFVH